MTEAIQGCAKHAPNPRTGDCEACRAQLRRNVAWLDAIRTAEELHERVVRDPIVAFRKPGEGDRTFTLFQTERHIIEKARTLGLRSLPTVTLTDYLPEEQRLDTLDAELTPEGYAAARAALLSRFYGDNGQHRRRGIR